MKDKEVILMKLYDVSELILLMTESSFITNMVMIFSNIWSLSSF